MLERGSPRLAVLFALLATVLLASGVQGSPVMSGEGQTFVVTTTADSGVGSLRQAILDANGNPGLDRIEFAMPPTMRQRLVYVIELRSLLPPITDGVVIDGTSQRGYQVRKGPVVEISGLGLAKACQGPSLGRYRDWPGLDVRRDPNSAIDASGTSIRGLRISAFCQGVSVSGEVELDESAAIQPSHGCKSGGERITDITIQGNVLEHNDEGNAALDLCNAEHSTVQDNYLENKTDEIEIAHSEYVLVLGNSALGGKDGLSLVASTHITIQNNVFRSSERGIYQKFDAADSQILGNHILDVDTFGMIVGDGNLVKGNTVTGSGWFGIEVRGASHNVIEENVVRQNGTGGIVVGAGGRRAIADCLLDDSGLPYNCTVNWSPFRQGSGSNNLLRNNTVVFNNGPGIVVGGRYREWDAQAEAYGGDAEFVAENNTLLGNVIYGNQGLGIDLSDEVQFFVHLVGAPYVGFYIESPAAKPDGPTPNNSDILANHGQNAPALTSAHAAAGRTVVQGSIDMPDPQTARIELFANRVPRPGGDPSGYGEGAWFVGSVTPDAQGEFTALIGPLPVGTLISATATDADGNTSEFAADIAVTGQGR